MWTTLSGLDRRQRVQALLATVLVVAGVVTVLTQDRLFPLVAGSLAAGYGLSTLWTLYRDAGDDPDEPGGS
jgi:EamA domain-containing membrane protein RarD